MVLFHVKKGDKESFLYETTCDTSNDVVIREIVEIWNMRLRLGQLCGALREMGQYGPMKKPDSAGLDEVAEKYSGASIEKNEFYQADPTGARTGNGVGPQLMETIERVCQDAEAVLSPNYAAMKKTLTLDLLVEKLDNMRGSVVMAYPMGLPEWDTVRLTIEGVEGLEGTAAGQELLDSDRAELWIASRQLERSQTVADRLGKNEKTKVIAKMQQPGGGCPGREAGVSEEEKKSMMAYYFKKQEELKQLSESNDDDYLHSAWADPKALQRSLRGQSGNVRAPGVK
jgi:hypothetical protein